MRRIRRHSLQGIISVVIVVLFITHTTGDLRLPLLDQLEYLAYDTRLALTLPGGVDERIVIVDVDEASLAAEGRWPWSRTKIAEMVDTLFDHYRVNVLGFDIVFTEPERNEFLIHMEKRLKDRDPELLQKIQALGETTDPDGRLGKSLHGRKAVLGYYFSNQSERAGQLPEPIDPFASLSILKPRRALGHGANLAVLQKNALSGGYFDNPVGDKDGVFRRAPMLTEFEGGFYASLSFAIAQAFLGGEFIADKNGEFIAIGKHEIPVDAQVAALIPYRGPQFSFPYVSATDVLNRKVDTKVLKDKIVILGTTAPGLYDLRSTPVQKEYAGVEIHANLVAGILDGRFLHQPGFAEAAELVQLTIIGLLMALFVPLLGAGTATAVTLSLLGLTSGVNLLLWTKYAMVLPLAPVVTLILLLFLFNTAYGFLVESSTRRQLSHRFGQYVPPELVDEMNRAPSTYSVTGDRRLMTVLFSDIRNFTSISEQLDPQELSELMNALLTPMTHAIHRNRGTIDKYMGDAIMAFWGAPVQDEEHAYHAIVAAVAMQEELTRLRQEFVARGWPEVHMGVGLASGEMNVGNMGSEFRMAYTVMGDSVNLGSRVEGLTKIYKVKILVVDRTAELAPQFVYRELDRVRVKGRERPVTIFEPVDLIEHLDEAQQTRLKDHQRALEAYRAGDWDAAEQGFRKLAEFEADHGLYQAYLDRISQFREQPPVPGWDGVFSYEIK